MADLPNDQTVEARHAARLAHLPPEIAAHANPRHSVGELLRDGFRAFAKSLEERIARHGVSGPHWRFLRTLWRQDGLTQRELSERVGMREPTTATALGGLVAAGLVTRTPSTQDRRKVHVHLTRKAADLEPVLLPLVAEVNDIALAGFTEAEIATLRDMLERIHGNLVGALKGVPVENDEV